MLYSRLNWQKVVFFLIHLDVEFFSITAPKSLTPIVVRYEVFKGRTLPFKLKTKHKISSAPVI